VSRGGLRRVRPNEIYYTQLLSRPPLRSSEAWRDNWERIFGGAKVDDVFDDDDETEKPKQKRPLDTARLLGPDGKPLGSSSKKLWHDDDDERAPAEFDDGPSKAAR
jgi:hypothetical protein